MILHITGPAKSGKSTIAVALRNSQIGQAKGCLLCDEQQEGEARYQLEKIIAGMALPAEPIGAAAVTWKQEPWVIVVGDKIGMLDEFEALVPGFMDVFGPVHTVTTGISAGE